MDVEVPRRVQNTMQRRAYIRAAEKQLTAEKQPIERSYVWRGQVSCILGIRPAAFPVRC